MEIGANIFHMRAALAIATVLALDTALCTSAHAEPGAGAGAEFAVDGLTFLRLAHFEAGWYRRRMDLHVNFNVGKIDGNDEGDSGWATEALVGVRGYVVCGHHLCAGASLKLGWGHDRWTAGMASGVDNFPVFEPELDLSVRPSERWSIELSAGLRSSATGDGVIGGLDMGVVVVFRNFQRAREPRRLDSN